MYCQSCGIEYKPGDRFCSSCGGARLVQEKQLDQIEEELHLVIPMGTPISAVIAGYLGLFSVLVLPAPFAFGMGIVGLRQIKKSGKRYGKVRCWVGIILGGLVTLLIGGMLIYSVIIEAS